MDLIREIIVPTENIYTLHLPDTMIGKSVEVIAFEIDKKQSFEKSKEEKWQAFIDSANNLKIDLSDFKFNRDEANDYD